MKALFVIAVLVSFSALAADYGHYVDATGLSIKASVNERGELVSQTFGLNDPYPEELLLKAKTIAFYARSIGSSSPYFEMVPWCFSAFGTTQLGPFVRMELP